MSLFAYPKPGKEPAMKGRIGLARRVHYVLETNADRTSAVGSCRKVKGPVDLVGPYTKATCPECIGLLMNRKIRPTITVAKEVL